MIGFLLTGPLLLALPLLLLRIWAGSQSSSTGSAGLLNRPHPDESSALKSSIQGKDFNSAATLNTLKNQIPAEGFAAKCEHCGELSTQPSAVYKCRACGAYSTY